MKTANIEEIKAHVMQNEHFLRDLERHSMTFEECGIIQLSNETGRFKKDEEAYTRDIQNGWRDITIMVNVNALPISYQCNLINDDEERAKRLARVGMAS